MMPSLGHTFADDLPELVVDWQAAPVSEPRTVIVNVSLAEELGLDPEWLRSAAGARFLAGTDVPDGARPVAMAYAGHQFGGYSPRLGDGRALLLGELGEAGELGELGELGEVVVDPRPRRRDLHLKGSGRTPFARGGDGKAALGPMLREFVVGEAMHALGIPTTRALAVLATGEAVARETTLPGAVLVRVAASHLRVGTFQYAAAAGGDPLVRRLADHAIDRHYPAASGAANRYLAFYESVVQAQAELIARWMHVGFIHGVMNTDNMTISGETIDYGPCAFMDEHDPATVFSSIDHGGRYAYGNQPHIAQWNLARLAETLLPLLGGSETEAVDAATELLVSFPDRYDTAWRRGMSVKLALPPDPPDARHDGLIDDLLAAMQAERLDHTGTFRSLAGLVGGGVSTLPGEWLARWRAAVGASGLSTADAARHLAAVNPVYVPRNHLVEAALEAATGGDLAPLAPLVQAVTHPFVEQPGLEAYAEPDPGGGSGFRTFCGT